MDKNVDLCSAVECTAAHPRLTKSPKEEEKSLYVFSVSVLLLASVERFGVSRKRDLKKINLFLLCAAVVSHSQPLSKWLRRNALKR